MYFPILGDLLRISERMWYEASISFLWSTFLPLESQIFSTDPRDPMDPRDITTERRRVGAVATSTPADLYGSFKALLNRCRSSITLKHTSTSISIHQYFDQISAWYVNHPWKVSFYIHNTVFFDLENIQTIRNHQIPHQNRWNPPGGSMDPWISRGSWLGSMLFSTQVASDAPPTKGSRQRTMQLPPGGTSGLGWWMMYP